MLLWPEPCACRDDREDFFGLENLPADIEIACFGTCSILANQASPTCCWRHASSRFTMMYGLPSQIRGRIVECDVTVLSNPKKRDIDGCGCQLLPGIFHASRRIGRIAIEQVITRDSSLADQLLHQHFAKAAGMRDRQADVFIQMKRFEFSVDSRRLGEHQGIRVCDRQQLRR